MPVDDHDSLATLLDELRPLIVAAHAQNKNPRYVLLGASAYDAVAAVKSGDLERGMPMIVLGLEIVRADESAAAPNVF